MSAQTPSSDRARLTPRPGFFARLTLGALLLATPVAASHAQDTARLLDAPRATGQAGERFDGYAVARGSVPAAVAATIAQVNAQRRAVYEDRARAQGATADATGRIYAAEIIRLAPAGTWFLSETGVWTQK